MLKRFGLCIKNALAAQQNSPLGFGSEFRKAATLRSLLHRHPNWTRFEKGSDWPLDEINEEDRKKDVIETFNFGNHKGASSDPKLLTSLVRTDVIHGFSVPLPLENSTPSRASCLLPSTSKSRTKSTAPAT